MRKLGILLLATGLAFAAPARAEETRTTGVQEQPPGPPAAVPAPLSQDDSGRRAVRGCPMGQRCVRLEDEMRAFELEAFSPGDPWVEREHAPAPLRGGERTTRATDLRPDLPWLADLAMPDLPVRWDDRLIEYLRYYKEDPRGRATMRRWLEAQGRYRNLIVERLRRARLPEDLLYVAMIESSYNPSVTSYAGASGLWQLMPDGGRIYGLGRDRWVDERLDPVRATEGVIDYWADLYQRFGDWALALAAYNAGYGAVLRAVARYNTNDFWLLTRYENALPWDTALYVPKVLAVAIVGHNRERFGFGDLDVVAAERWEDVRVPTSVSLSVIARAADCSVDAIKRLNPQLRRNRTPPGRPDFTVRVPAGAGARFAKKLGELRPDWDGFDAYVVAYGERFEDVATQFGVSTRRLRELNDIEHESEVTGGSLLVVPRLGEELRRKNVARALESLYSSGVDQRPGEPLLVPVPDEDATVAGRRRVFYRVVIGDTLGGVARALDVSTRELAAWNALTEDANLHPRMVMQAWVAPSFDETRARVRLLDDSRILVVTRGSKRHLELAEARVGRERLEYTPERRESFEQIGKKFGLGSRDLGRINRMSHTTVVEPGQTIIVYRVIDKSRSERAAEQWKKTPRGERRKKPAARDDVKNEASDDGRDETPAIGSGEVAGDREEAPAPSEDSAATEPAAADGDEPKAKKAEADKAEADKADSRRDDEPKKAKSKRDKPSSDEPKAEPKKAESKKAEPARDEPEPSKKADSRRDDSRKPDSKKAESKRDEKAEPEKADSDTSKKADSDTSKKADSRNDERGTKDRSESKDKPAKRSRDAEPRAQPADKPTVEPHHRAPKASTSDGPVSSPGQVD